MTSSAKSAINAERLPPKIKCFLQQHYPNFTIKKYEVKTKTSGTEFEVKLNNLVEIEFDNDENWRELKDNNGVPDVLLRAKVKSYVTQNYKDIRIAKIDLKENKNQMKVEMLNDIDLKFYTKDIFLKIE